MNLQISDGIVELVLNSESKLIVTEKGASINDGSWHHVIATMPSKNCYMSDIVIYIDGIERWTTFIGHDSIVNFPRGGMLALGGFGYGGTSKGKGAIVERKGFRSGSSFIGAMDDVHVYTRSILSQEAQQLAGITVRPPPQPLTENPSSGPTISRSENPSSGPTISRSEDPSSEPTMSPSIESPTVSLSKPTSFFPSTYSPTLFRNLSSEPTKFQHLSTSIYTLIPTSNQFTPQPPTPSHNRSSTLKPSIQYFNQQTDFKEIETINTSSRSTSIQRYSCLLISIHVYFYIL